MRVRVGGAWRDVTSAKVRVDGAWRNITRIRAYVNGAWRPVKVFAAPISATANPTSVNNGRQGAGTVVTQTTTVTPSSGLAPYTYSWTRVGSGQAVATNPSSATTSFSRFVEANTFVTETFRCTVTDALASSTTVDVTAEFFAFDTGGGGFSPEP